MDKFEAVAVDHRRAILELVSPLGVELTPKVISTHLPVIAQTTSYHLGCLTEAGLLLRERRANKHFYSLDRDGILELERWFADRRQGLPSKDKKQ